MSAATNSVEMNDLALVRRAQSGEAAPFDRLVRKYWHSVVQIAMRYVRNRDDAEDAAQETFLRAYCALGKFRGDSAFYTWLCRIAMNAAMTMLALRSRHAAVFPETNTRVEPADADTPESLAQCGELCSSLNAAINELPEWQSTALMLHKLRGYSYREVAVAMGSPVGTVRSRISRARDSIDWRLMIRRHV